MQQDKDIPFIRRRGEKLRDEPGPKPDREQDQDWLFDQAKERLAAANEAITSSRRFSFALLSVAAYIGLVVWATTDEQLLRISPVKLPILNVEVPLTGFYTAVPILFVLIHFNLLIHLGFTSIKLKRFLDDIALLDTKLSDRLRNDVANFPLAQWMVGHNDAVFHRVLTVLVWIMLVLIPPFLLLWIQLRFLSYQDQFSTWLQTAAVAVDALLIVGFRAWLVRQIQPETGWIASAKELRKQRGLSLILWIRLLLTRPLFRYAFPLIPLGFAAFLSVELDNLLAASKVKSCFDKPETGEDRVSQLRKWHCSLYRLDLPEKLLTMNLPPPTVQNALHSDDSKVREKALDEIVGVQLKERHLKGAKFSASMLPNSDLRRAQLEGADLMSAQLEGADLSEAQLGGANLRGAKLEGADLRGAQLAGADLRGAQLEGADLRAAQLEGADLRAAQLKGANLREAQLQGAHLMAAQLKGANLMMAQLQGADLMMAQLQGANLLLAQLQGANLREALLNGAHLMAAQLEDANLMLAKMEGANLTLVQLKGANLMLAKLEGTNLMLAQLQEANLMLAKLEGANLKETRLEDANLSYALLKGANLMEAHLEGANLSYANLLWVDLTDSYLSFADLTSVENLETAELAGADYIFADGLEGTILDVNQAAPDFLQEACDGCSLWQP